MFPLNFLNITPRMISKAIKGVFKYEFIVLALRLALFVVVLVLYFVHSPLMKYPSNFFAEFLPLHLLWAFWFVLFASRIFPWGHRLAAGRKAFARYYVPPQVDSQHRTISGTQSAQNKGIIGVIILCLCVDVPLWILKLTGIIDAGFLVVATCFVFFLDPIFETVFCPFQVFFLKNRCCSDCRIYSWNSLMICSPLIANFDFFSLSLVFVCLVSLLRYEISHLRHPEFFSSSSNIAISCVNCEKKMCTLRGKNGRLNIKRNDSA